jgi:DNA-binding CsgD family transcriptional regulator/tetratricopeptide (TPR) repeat protein
LRGRDAELAVLSEAIGSLALGQGGVVLVEGAAGSGKTSLLREAVAMAERSHLRVYADGGDPAAELMPLAPLMNALLTAPEPVLDRAALREIAQLADARFWVMQEMQDRLERAALKAPLMIVLGDLQWFDGATLLALRTLPRRVATHAILWLVAARPGAATETVEALRRGGAVTVELHPLPREAVAQLVVDVLGAEPDDRMMKLTDEVGGRAFLLVELLRGLRDEGLVAIEDGRAVLVAYDVPVRFRKTVADQLQRLSAPARETVLMASVLPRRFTAEHLGLLLDRTPAALLESLEEIMRAELLVESGEQLAFRHDLIREAVDAGLPASLRRALRRRVVDLMREHGAPDVEVAALLLDVAEPGDRTAISVLRRAAATVGASDAATAATLSTHAVELTPADDPERHVVVAETIPLLFAAGRPSEARHLADTALKGLLAPPAEALLRLQLAQVSVQYTFGEVVRQCERALALPGLPPELRMHLGTLCTFGLLLDGEHERAFAAMDGDLQAARAAGDRLAESSALNTISGVLFHCHRYEEALAAADESAALAAAIGAGPQRLWPDIWAAWLRSALGRPDTVLPAVSEGLRAAQREGRAPDVRFWLMCHSRVLLAAGRLADARAEGEAVLEMVADLGLGSIALNTTGYALAKVALHTGDRQALSAAAEAADELLRDETLTMRRGGAWIAALLADGDGDHERAMELLRGTYAALGTIAPVLSAPPDAVEILLLVRMALRAGDHERAEAAAREAERRASLNPGFALHALLRRHARGLVDRDPDAMRASLEHLSVLQSPVARAEVLEDAADVLSETARDEAVSCLDDALVLFVAAGAERDAARVRGLLRELGVRRRVVKRPTPKGTTVWAGLTQSELAVVRVVAEGATNRQAAERLYVSPHTVHSHLRHAFTKLGIRSRVELAVLYADHAGARG